MYFISTSGGTQHMAHVLHMQPAALRTVAISSSKYLHILAHCEHNLCSRDIHAQTAKSNSRTASGSFAFGGFVRHEQVTKWYSLDSAGDFHLPNSLTLRCPITSEDLECGTLCCLVDSNKHQIKLSCKHTHTHVPV